jgi:hypothetical protein
MPGWTYSIDNRISDPSVPGGLDGYYPEDTYNTTWYLGACEVFVEPNTYCPIPYLIGCSPCVPQPSLPFLTGRVEQ